MFADPPYNLGKDFGASKDRWPSPAAYADWVLARVDACVPALTDDASLMIMDHPRYAAYLIPGLDRRGLHYVNELIYHYTDGIPERSQFARRYEVVLYYRRRPDRCCFNVDSVLAPLVRCDRTSNPEGANPGDVWQINRVRWNARERVRTADNKIAHPTQKPLRLMRRLILAATDPGDAVLDPFAGTGTTGVAARQLGRRSCLLELNPEYAYIARRRLAEAQALGLPCPPDLR